MKKTTFFLISLLAPLIVFGQGQSISPTSRANAQANQSLNIDKESDAQARQDLSSSKSESNQTKLLEQYRSSGEKFCTNRITVMERVLANINNSSMNTATKTRLTAEIQNQIQSLNQLKIQIQNESDLTQLRNQIRSIFRNRYVFAVSAPKFRGLAGIAKVEEALLKLESLQASLTKTVEQADPTNANLAQAQEALTDYSEQLAVAKKAVASAKSELEKCDPQDLNASKEYIANAKTSLQEAKQALSNIKEDIAIIQLLNQTESTQ